MRINKKFGEYIKTDADNNIIDSKGEIAGKYNPSEKLNIIGTFFWFNDLRGRLKQEFEKPPSYKNQPRLYIREDVERNDDGELVSHLKVYYGGKLLAKTTKVMPEYVKEFISNNDQDMRFQMRATVNYLLNEGGWKLYKVEELDDLMRKSKKSKPKSRKPMPKKVIKKVVCKCKRK